MVRIPRVVFIESEIQMVCWSGLGRAYDMLEAKDFAAGCLTIILCAVLVPLFYLVFKLTLFFAVLSAIALGIFLGITVLGRIVRFLFTGK
jgi:hypothetical protein